MAVVLPGAGDYLGSVYGAQAAADKHRASQGELQGLQLQNQLLAKHLSHYDEMQNLTQQKELLGVQNQQLVNSRQQLLNEMALKWDDLHAQDKHQESLLTQKATAGGESRANEDEIRKARNDLADRMDKIKVEALRAMNPESDFFDAYNTATGLVNSPESGVADSEKFKAILSLTPQIDQMNQARSAELKRTKQDSESLQKMYNAKLLEAAAQTIHGLGASGLGATEDGKNFIKSVIQPIFPNADFGDGPLTAPRSGALTPDQQVKVAAAKAKVVGLTKELQEVQSEYNAIAESGDKVVLRDKQGNRSKTYPFFAGQKKQDLKKRIDSLTTEINSLDPDSALKSAVSTAVASQAPSGPIALPDSATQDDLAKIPSGTTFTYKGKSYVKK